MIAVAVDCALPGNGEAVAPVGVDESREILAALALDTGVEHREVGYAVAPLQFSTFVYIQVRLGTEEQRAAEERSLRHDHHSAAVTRRPVNHRLYGGGLHQCAVLRHPIVGNDVFPAEGINIHFPHVAEPRVHLRAVGPTLRLRGIGFLLFLRRVGVERHKRHHASEQ